MDFNELKAVLQEADKETEMTRQDYSKKSSVHRAALQIMQFEKKLYYGDASSGRHLQKIKDIIVDNAEDIVNEANKVRS